MIRQAVGKVGEHVEVNAVGSRGGFLFWQPRKRVAGVGRAHRNLVAAPCEAAREASDEPWYPPVRPGAGGVGRDVKDVQQPSLDNRLVIDL